MYSKEYLTQELRLRECQAEYIMKYSEEIYSKIQNIKDEVLSNTNVLNNSRADNFMGCLEKTMLFEGMRSENLFKVLNSFKIEKLDKDTFFKDLKLIDSYKSVSYHKNAVEVKICSIANPNLCINIDSIEDASRKLFDLFDMSFKEKYESIIGDDLEDFHSQTKELYNFKYSSEEPLLILMCCHKYTDGEDMMAS